MKYTNEIAKRRTFAIISHPDAGKTTLTEKLLLFGGAIQVAGAVKSNKIKKHATSDFMEIERQRGISVATSVMSFEYNNILINLLDTPGHKDFAEDTYRTLTAVDSVILVIDSVNGVEEQTRKLVEVCRMRDTPIIVFVNKLDRDGKFPFDLLDEIEKELIEGTLETENLPAKWNELYQKYLGITPPDNRSGVLQDVHWSHGMFGYFPTYTLGSFYACQFYDQALKDISGLQAQIQNGEMAQLLTWLRTKIHQYGRRYTSEELCIAITGKKLDPSIFIEQMAAKYKDVYGISF